MKCIRKITAFLISAVLMLSLAGCGGSQKAINERAGYYRATDTTQQAAFEAVVAPVAKEAGFDFTYEEVAEAAMEAAEGEIPDDEAADEAGGFSLGSHKSIHDSLKK